MTFLQGFHLWAVLALAGVAALALPLLDARVGGSRARLVCFSLQALGAAAMAADCLGHGLPFRYGVGFTALALVQAASAFAQERPLRRSARAPVS